MPPGNASDVARSPAPSTSARPLATGTDGAMPVGVLAALSALALLAAPAAPGGGATAQLRVGATVVRSVAAEASAAVATTVRIRGPDRDASPGPGGDGRSSGRRGGDRVVTFLTDEPEGAETGEAR